MFFLPCISYLASFFIVFSLSYIRRDCIALYSLIHSIKKTILFFYHFTWYQSHGRFGLGFYPVFNSDNPSSEGGFFDEFSSPLSDGPFFSDNPLFSDNSLSASPLSCKPSFWQARPSFSVGPSFYVKLSLLQWTF